MSIISDAELAKRMLQNLPVGSRRKIAMIVSLATRDLPDLENLENSTNCAVVNSALDLLAENPDIQSFGNIHNWRYAEMARAPFPIQQLK
ncbi:hypothetical protein [Cypionkella sp. TWP1-2-1b2]|uniref:hypothetical protein n=1 Tax=Cypionkella sp. TWP1-2-1b2 TaxID=2804675 RepID=UPI003CED4994